MAKQSAYQKLKGKNLKLKHDLSILSNKPESIEAMQIKMTWVIHKRTEDAMWQGVWGSNHRDIALITTSKETYNGFIEAYEKAALHGHS